MVFSIHIYLEGGFIYEGFFKATINISLKNILCPFCFAVISEGSLNDAYEILLLFFFFFFILCCFALIAKDKEPIEGIISIHSDIIGHTNLLEVSKYFFDFSTCCYIIHGSNTQ